MGPVLRAIVSLVAVVSLSATPSLMAMCLAWCLPALHGASHVDAAHHAAGAVPDTATDAHAHAGHDDSGAHRPADHHGAHESAADAVARDASPLHAASPSRDDSRVSSPAACACCDDAPAAVAAVSGPRPDGFAAAVAALPSRRPFDVVATFARALPSATRAPDPSPPRTPLVLRI